MQQTVKADSQEVTMAVGCVIQSVWEPLIMAEISRNRRNTLERKCLPKSLKRLFKGSTRTTFKMLEKVKPTKNTRS